MRSTLALTINVLCRLSGLGGEKGRFQPLPGGPCHLLRDSDYPLPAAFDLAYGQAAAVFLETDIGALNSPEIQKKMAAELFYDDGRSLQEAPSPKTWQTLGVYCRLSLMKIFDESQGRKFGRR